MTMQLAGGGRFRATLLAIGIDFVIPAGGAVSGRCDRLAVGSGVALVGLLDGA